MDFSLLVACFSAFMGGIILNFMPCVLPILSLKVLSLLKSKEQTQKEVKRHGLTYLAGVMLAFSILSGILYFLKSHGSAVVWGYQMQSYLFVTIMTYILFLVGLNLIGFFDITFSYMGIGDKYASKKGYIGSFFTGILIVLVSTPCSVPLMAPALGYALSQDILTMFLVIEFLGLGVAFPYLIMCLFPNIRQFLPRPGNWMITLKEAMSFPIFLSVIWLLWVLSNQLNSNYTAILMCGLVFITFIIWAWSKVRIFTKYLLLVSLFTFNIYFLSPNTTQTDGEYIDFSNTAIQNLQSKERDFFIYFTADWCLTCKTNEINLIKTSEFQNFITSYNIIVLKADLTQKNDEAAEYLEMFNKKGVPHYMMHSSNGKVGFLGQILSIDSLNDLESFYNNANKQ